VPLYVFIGALCVAFAMLNLPGEPQQPRYGTAWLDEANDFEIRHGWPLIFAIRRVSTPEAAGDFDELLKTTDIWALGAGLTRFSLVAVVVDLALAALAIVAAGRIFLWLQAIGWPRQFTVRTLLGAMLATAALCACLCDGGRAKPRLTWWSSFTMTSEVRGCGPAWLRQIAGPWPLSRFDKTVGICLLSCEPRLNLTIEDVHQLSRFPGLEEATLIGFDLPEGVINQLASLPRLKRIRLLNCTVTGEAVLGVPIERAHCARDGDYLLVRKGAATVLARYSSPD